MARHVPGELARRHRRIMQLDHPTYPATLREIASGRWHSLAAAWGNMGDRPAKVFCYRMAARAYALARATAKVIS